MTACPRCQSMKSETGAAIGRYPLLEKLLPEGYAPLVCFYQETAQSQFRAHLKLRISSEDGAQKWLEDFQTSSGVTWRKSKTYPNTGRYNSYRVDLRCQYNTFPKTAAKKTKNTSCGATMFLVLKRNMESQQRKSRSKDPHIQDGYLLNINLRHEHNHWVSRDAATRKRDVSSETVAKLKMLYDSGHSPSTALHMIKYDLRLQEGENYIHAAADRSICPDIQFCHRLYHKLFQQSYRSPSAKEMLVDLRNRLDQYNELQGDSSAKIDQIEDGQLIVAICTPVMKRVHMKLRESGEILFVDSVGNCERQSHCMFLLLTQSTAGPLPLGVFITTSKSQFAVTSGLQLLLTVIPRGGFFGRGQPRLVMTDDCRVLRHSLQAVFPEAKLLLSMFHQLQGTWRWLWRSHNGVARDDRGHLLHSFKSMVYADSALSLTAEFNNCLADPLAKKYPRFLHHLEKVYGRKAEWALCLCNDLPARGYNTHHFVESAVQVAKEMLLYRLKAYNATQMIDFVTTRMEAHCVRRLTDAALSGTAELISARVSLHGNDVDCDKIEQQLDQNHYVVKSSTSEYDVNVAVGCCTCAVGVTGTPCKHQSAVLNKFGHPESVSNIITPQMKKLFNEIAIGSSSTLEQSRNESPSVTNSRTSVPPGEHLEQMVQLFCKSLTDKLKGDPLTFTAPIRTFLETYQKLNDDSLASALCSFGKVPPQQPPRIIVFQPTAVVKRKAELWECQNVKNVRPLKCLRMEQPTSEVQQSGQSVSHSTTVNEEEGPTVINEFSDCNASQPPKPFLKADSQMESNLTLLS